jgi:diacylglycerol O-acyltransferase / wax synthase
VKAASASMKSTMGGLKDILPTDFPSLGVPWLMEAATALYGKARVADRIPQLANVVISNVPGPPVPLYMAGAHMLTNYPTSIVVHGIALNITVQSYDRSMDFGLMADAQAMPDVKELADAIRIGFEDLQALPLPGEEGEDGADPSWMIMRAAKSLGSSLGGTIGGAMGKVAKGVVDTAVEQAVSQVTGRGRKPRVAPPVRRRDKG